ncbi:MAG: DUF2085 domain-containing protein [Acetivibrionales bacterium]|jgi:uncharacterized membrane protein
MDTLIDIFMKIGSMMCHQLPERTLYVSNMPLPMCARDTGIYFGVFSAFAYTFFNKRLRANKPPSLKQAVLLCLFMLPMVLDAISSYLGLRSTNNTIRLFTGALFGVSIPFLLVPAANFKVYNSNTEDIIKDWKEPFCALLIAIALCVAVLKTGLIPWIVVSSILVFSLTLLISRMVYTVFIRTGFSSKAYFNGMVVGASAIIILLLFMLSNYILHPLIDVWIEKG